MPPKRSRIISSDCRSNRVSSGLSTPQESIALPVLLLQHADHYCSPAQILLINVQAAAFAASYDCVHLPYTFVAASANTTKPLDCYNSVEPGLHDSRADPDEHLHCLCLIHSEPLFLLLGTCIIKCCIPKCGFEALTSMCVNLHQALKCIQTVLKCNSSTGGRNPYLLCRPFPWRLHGSILCNPKHSHTPLHHI